MTGLLLVAPVRSARAADAVAPADQGGDIAEATDARESDGAEYRRLAEPPGRAARIFSTLAFGDGLRFNNPYRLRTQLGQDARSLSLTSGYLDLGVATAFGPADGLQHGAALHVSIGLAGVAQQAIAPSCLVAYRGGPRVLAYGRLGASILTMPDLNAGAELAGGLGYFLTSKLAISGEIVADLFYGAATYDATYTVYPVLSAQLGLMVDHELLP